MTWYISGLALVVPFTETTAVINKALPELKVQGAGDARSVFVYDPSGIRVQLMAKEDKGAEPARRR